MTSAPPRHSLIDLPETALVRFILSEVGTLYEYFNFVVEPAIGPPPREGWDYIFLAEVKRHWLGLSREGLPGDVDVLIVPTFNNRLRVDLSCASEVKRLALRGPNWQKNVDRYGISQAQGLLADGFPFVGILHIVVSEEGPKEYQRQLEQWRVVGNRGHAERIGPVWVDMTGYDAAERQLLRLASRTCSPEVGINSVALMRKAGADRMWVSTRPTGTRYAKRNLEVSPALLRGIGQLIYECRDRIKMRPADIRELEKVGR